VAHPVTELFLLVGNISTFNLAFLNDLCTFNENILFPFDLLPTAYDLFVDPFGVDHPLCAGQNETFVEFEIR
jgi:hypothetical protein